MSERVFESDVERDIFQFFAGDNVQVVSPPTAKPKSTARLSDETMGRIKLLLDKLDAITPRPQGVESTPTQEVAASQSTIDGDIANFFRDGWEVPATDQAADLSDK